jgi:hypothetical protein
MGLEDITLWLFAICNSVRVLAYVPQMRTAAVDEHGASAVSCTTWSLFLVAHVSTVAYALVNRGDWGLAACFAVNALGCLAIIAITCWKRRCHAAQLRHPEPRGNRHVRSQERAGEPREAALVTDPALADGGLRPLIRSTHT